MGRTKLRGIELAGVRIAIEAPSWCDWSWPASLRERGCLASSPDVYLALRFAETPPVSAGASESESSAGVRELSRSAQGCVVAVDTGGPDQRLARFEAGFHYGEIEMSARSLARALCPIAHPLGEWIVAQRTLCEGGLVVWGSAATRGRRALVFLGDHAPRDLGSEGRVAAGWLVLRPAADGVRVVALGPGSGTGVAWVQGVHVADSMFSDGCAPAVLDSEAAAAELLRYTFSPLAAAEGADRSLEAASSLARRVSVIRTGLAAGARRFAWQRGRAEAALDASGPASLR
jgi:hypothetical protein